MPDENCPAPRAPAPNAPNATRAGGDPAATTGAESYAARPAPAPALQRYMLGDEIARGGMGAVHVATDTVLGREVAIKVLQLRFAPTSAAATRFAGEARITAQLQHPAIPPVHDLGTLPDGRPFLAMKYIKGRTLADELVPPANPVTERGRFVAVFEQVCQAVAYAHAHNVIHRDLKPANIMVGKYGEVQVMDWGLAKVLTDRGATSVDDPMHTAAATEIHSLRDTDGSETQAGSVLGTPAFMPPEQAVGAITKIDARSDVFGLGAVLAVILTGKPPFAGGSAETTRILAAGGKLDACFTRLDACDADPELIALCKRCLSPEPAARPADAGEVARAVAAFRAAAEDRARRAELDRARADVQAAEQRKRRRALTAAGVVLVGVLVAGMIGTTTGLVRAETARDAETEQRKQAEQARDEADEQRRDAVRARDALAVALAAEAKAHTEADESYQLAREAIIGVAWDIPSILREAVYARKAQNQVLVVLAETLEKQLHLAATRGLPDRTMHAILLRMGDLRYAQGKWDEAQKHYDAALAISARLLKAEEREKDKAKGNHAVSHQKLGLLARDGRVNMTGALDHFGAAEKLQREVMNAPTTGEITPAEAKLYLSYTLYEIADVHTRRHNFDLALKVCEEAVKFREEAAKLPPNRNIKDASSLLADSLVQLGEIQFKRTQNAAAEKAMAAAVEIYQKEVARDPDNLSVRRQAASASRATGDFLLFLKRYDDAKPYHTRDIELSQGLLRIPEISNAQMDLSRAFYRSGTLALKNGDRAAALDLYRKCVTIRREVVAAQPWNDFAKLGLAGALARAGEHHESAEVLAALRKRFPRNISVLSESAAVLGMCADAILAGRKESELTLFEALRRRLYLEIALDSLDRTVTNWEWKDLVRLETDPDFDPIRNDPRFRAAVEVVKKREAEVKP